MMLFYLICCLLCMAIILCNLSLADMKLSTGQLIFSVVWGLIPVLNAVLLLAVVVVACNLVAKAEKK